jgi:hypothetical protein
MLVPWLPLRNFQEKGGHLIAAKAQRNLGRFADTMEEFQKALYNPNFRNPRKPYMRGAYKLSDRIGFQRDRLHNYGHIGAASRDDVFHLINAYHLFGVAIFPGDHSDVMTQGDQPLQMVFADIITEKTSLPGDRHINITPCDRVV